MSKAMYTIPKSWLKSKTVWLAVVQALIAGVVVFQSAYPDAGYLLLAKSALDIFLRYITTQPIE